MQFRKITDTLYKVSDLKEILAVIDRYTEISSGGNIQEDIFEEVVSVMLKYHVSNHFFKTGVGFDKGLGIITIQIPLSEVNIKKSYIKSDIFITLSEIITSKEGTKVRVCGKIRK